MNKIEHLDISGNRVKNYEGLGDYIAERLEKALNEGVGSIQFSGQGVNFGSTVEVNGKEVSFDTPCWRGGTAAEKPRKTSIPGAGTGTVVHTS